MIINELFFLFLHKNLCFGLWEHGGLVVEHHTESKGPGLDSYSGHCIVPLSKTQ